MRPTPTRSRLSLAIALTAMLGLVACDSDDDDDSSIDDDASAEIHVALSELIPTVVLVTWELDELGVEDAYVEYGYDDALGSRAQAEPDGEGSYGTALLGLRPDSEVFLRTVVVIEGETDHGELTNVTTGSKPIGLPTMTVSVIEEGRMPDGYLLTSLLSDPPAVAILDSQGHYVWWYQAEGESYVITRAHFAKDGRSIRFLGANPSGAGEAILVDQSVVRVALDGSEVSEITVLGAQRDFYEHEDGTVAMLVFDVRERAGEDVVGDRILEISPDGTEVEVWNVWDKLEYVHPYGSSFCHANGLDYDIEQDVYYLSCHNIDAVLKIDRSSGEILWRFGGDSWGVETGDFADSHGDSQLLYQQHQFQVLEDGIVVFNNQTIEENYSNVLEYEIDWETGLADLRWSYVSAPAQYCYVLGDVEKFPSGDTLITWSTAGRIELVSPDADMLWQMKLGIGAGFGYTTFRETLYDAP